MPTLVVAIDARESRKGADTFKRSVRTITGGAQQIDKSIGKADKGLARFGRRMVTFAAIYGIARFIKQTVNLAGVQEDLIAQLNARLKSTQGVSGQTIKSLRGLSDEMQRLTKFSNETVEEAQAILLTFTKISGKVFPRTIRSIADVATVMRIDLRSATVQLAKALNDPIANLGALSRSGIQFTKVQKSMIKQLWETGRVAEAQTLILKELENQYGGAAKAVGMTLAGALARAKNAWDDFKKALGDVIFRDMFQWFAEQSRITFERWTKWVNNNRVIIRQFMVEVVAWGKRLGAVFGLIVDGLQELWTLIRPLVSLQLKLQKGALGLFGGLIPEGMLDMLKNISPHLDKFIAKLNEINVWAAKQKRLVAEGPVGLGIPDAVQIEGSMSAWAQFMSRFRQGMASVKQMELAAEGIGEAFGTAFERAILGAEKLSNVFEGLLKDITAAIVRAAVIQPLVAGITKGLTPATSAMGNVFQSGRMMAFAGGGIVSRPTLFPMAAGGVGLMGEAGPEAILPLKRGANGRLGVEAGAEGGGRAIVVNMNINTPDVDGFRQSRDQISSEIQRALNR